MASAPASRTAGAEEVNGPKRSMLAGVLMGIGVAGFIDETIFHQLLHCITSTTSRPPAGGSSPTACFTH